MAVDRSSGYCTVCLVARVPVEDGTGTGTVRPDAGRRGSFPGECGDGPLGPALGQIQGRKSMPVEVALRMLIVRDRYAFS